MSNKQNDEIAEHRKEIKEELRGLGFKIPQSTHIFDIAKDIIEMNKDWIGVSGAIGVLNPGMMARLFSWYCGELRKRERYNEAFEVEGEAFESVVGMLRPGKDQAVAMGGHPTDKERQEAWDEWCERLRKLRGEAPTKERRKEDGNSTR